MFFFFLSVLDHKSLGGCGEYMPYSDALWINLLLIVHLVPAFIAMSIAGKKYDVVVFGATGFTGKLVCQYIAQQYTTSTGLKWGIAGRNIAALESIKQNLNVDIDVLQYDVTDADSIDRITRETTCVLTTAGPFDLIGMPLVESCVRNNAHYVDITGEPQFCRKVIDQLHEEAKVKRLKIVNCCGFDCIPADMGCHLIVEHLQKKNLTPIEARYITLELKGGISGGTIASALNMMRSPQVMQRAKNPYYLCSTVPDKDTVAKNSDFEWYDFDPIARRWCMPHIMQAIDTRIVHRSNELSGWKYGRNFVWGERMAASGFLSAFISALASYFLQPLLKSKFLLDLVSNFLPKPGMGPSEDLLNNGFMKMKYWAKGVDSSDGKEKYVSGGLIATNGDPGYKLTARMVTECALCNVFEKSSPEVYGVLTPSVAFGATLRKRLSDIGFNFYIDE